MERFEPIVNGDPGTLPHPEGTYVLYSEAHARIEALEKALRWVAPFVPKDGTIDVAVQAALTAADSATEATR